MTARRRNVPGLAAPAMPGLSDPTTDRAVRNLADSVTKLAALPAAGIRVIPSVTLADGIETWVAHRLGRPPLWVGVSAARVPGNSWVDGAIIDRTTSPDFTDIDRDTHIILRADGYGADVVVDVLVL